MRMGFVFQVLFWSSAVLALVTALQSVAVDESGKVVHNSCPVISYEFALLTDEEQRRLAQLTNATVRSQKVLAIGGFGGSGTRAWASIFYNLGVPFVRGNGDWDAGYVPGDLHLLFPGCPSKAASAMLSLDGVGDVDVGPLHGYFNHEANFEYARRTNSHDSYSFKALLALLTKQGVSNGFINEAYGGEEPQRSWGLKQPDFITRIPALVDETEHVVGLVASRDPRDLVTRKFMHSTPDGSHLFSKPQLCGELFEHLDCNWQMLDVPKDEFKEFVKAPMPERCKPLLSLAWAITYSQIYAASQRHCPVDPAAASQASGPPTPRLFVGRSEDLVLSPESGANGAIIGFLQQVLAALGEVRSVEAIQTALTINMDTHSTDKRGRRVKKGTPTYGRWRNTSLQLNYDQLGPNFVATLDTFGYEIP